MRVVLPNVKMFTVGVHGCTSFWFYETWLQIPIKHAPTLQECNAYNCAYWVVYFYCKTFVKTYFNHYFEFIAKYNCTKNYVEICKWIFSVSMLETYSHWNFKTSRFVIWTGVHTVYPAPLIGSSLKKFSIPPWNISLNFFTLRVKLCRKQSGGGGNIWWWMVAVFFTYQLCCWSTCTVATWFFKIAAVLLVNLYSCHLIF